MTPFGSFAGVCDGLKQTRRSLRSFQGVMRRKQVPLILPDRLP